MFRCAMPLNLLYPWLYPYVRRQAQTLMWQWFSGKLRIQVQNIE